MLQSQGVFEFLNISELCFSSLPLWFWYRNVALQRRIFDVGGFQFHHVINVPGVRWSSWMRRIAWPKQLSRWTPGWFGIFGEASKPFADVFWITDDHSISSIPFTSNPTRMSVFFFRILGRHWGFFWGSWGYCNTNHSSWDPSVLMRSPFPMAVWTVEVFGWSLKPGCRFWARLETHKYRQCTNGSAEWLITLVLYLLM